MTIESALMICQKKTNELEKLRIIDDWSYQESGGNPELEFLKFVESIIKSFIKIDLDKPITKTELFSAEIEKIYIVDDTDACFGVTVPTTKAAKHQDNPLGWWTYETYGNDWMAYRYDVLSDLIPERVVVPEQTKNCVNATYAFLDALENKIQKLHTVSAEIKDICHTLT